jgi:hypothetical protein
VDAAAELLEAFEELPAVDRSRFRTLDLSAGDTTWAEAIHTLEHDLPFLDEQAAAMFQGDVRNFAQQQFLANLVEHLSPSEPETETPQQIALWRDQGKRVRDLAKRLNR